jgi:hypothetical protein
MPYIETYTLPALYRAREYLPTTTSPAEATGFPEPEDEEDAMSYEDPTGKRCKTCEELNCCKSCKACATDHKCVVWPWLVGGLLGGAIVGGLGVKIAKDTKRGRR